MGLEVLTAGGRPTFAQSAKRNLFMLTAMLPFVGGLIGAALAIAIAVSIGSDPKGRGLHDRWAGVVLDHD